MNAKMIFDKLYIIRLLVYVAALSGALFAISSNAQQAQEIPASNDLLYGVDTIRPAPLPGQRSLMPVVDVDRNSNQSKVNVHVPIFFDMTNLNNPDKSKLDLSVMHGLVTVQKDKERDENGQMTGPLKVTVFGIPVYTARGNSRNAEILDDSIRRTRKQLEDSITGGRTVVGNRAEEFSRKVADQVHATNGKVSSSLTGFLDRVTELLRQSSPSVGIRDASGMQAQQQRQFGGQEARGFVDSPSQQLAQLTPAAGETGAPKPSVVPGGQIEQPTSAQANLKITDEPSAKKQASRSDGETFTYH